MVIRIDKYLAFRKDSTIWAEYLRKSETSQFFIMSGGYCDAVRIGIRLKVLITKIKFTHKHSTKVICPFVLVRRLSDNVIYRSTLAKGFAQNLYINCTVSISTKLN